MSRETAGLGAALLGYVQRWSAAGESAELAGLREATAPLEMARMQVSVEQGRFMAWLVGALGARRCLEVGVFTGYSALAVALALPEDGSLVACDVSEEWTSVGRPFWERAGVAGKIDLRLGAAQHTLARMIEGGEAASFDFAFVDADKTGYPGYYEQCLELLRTGGVMLFDNAFGGGRVAAPDPEDDAAVALDRTNRTAFADPRVAACFVPVSDGLLMVRKL